MLKAEDNWVISTKYKQLKSLEVLNYIDFLQCSVADSTPDIFHRSRRQCGLATQENDRLLGPAYQLDALLDLC